MWFGQKKKKNNNNQKTTTTKFQACHLILDMPQETQGENYKP